MDLAAIKAALEAERKLEVEAAGAKFHLLLPSEHAWRVALEAHRDAHGQVLETSALRAVLDTALTGWSGVTARHLLPEAAEEALEFSKGARAALLDSRQDIADALALGIGERLAERRRKREAARKNS